MNYKEEPITMKQQNSRTNIDELEKSATNLSGCSYVERLATYGDVLNRLLEIQKYLNASIAKVEARKSRDMSNVIALIYASLNGCEVSTKLLTEPFYDVNNNNYHPNPIPLGNIDD